MSADRALAGAVYDCKQQDDTYVVRYEDMRLEAVGARWTGCDEIKATVAAFHEELLVDRIVVNLTQQRSKRQFIAGFAERMVTVADSALVVLEDFIRQHLPPVRGRDDSLPDPVSAAIPFEPSQALLDLLRDRDLLDHLKHAMRQAKIKMRNRQRYRDHGLAFCKDWSDVTRHGDTLGNPLQVNNLGQREFARIMKAAEVRTIKFHGLRHTCATLLLAAGVPSKVVQERLGHKKIGTTLDTYAHVLPSMQRAQPADLP